MHLSGNYTAIITPFKSNEEIDIKKLKELTKRQVELGTTGIVALGSTAEAPTLDAYEKHKVMEAIVSEAKDKVQIIAGVNAFSLQDAINQSTARFLDGADALLISPPPYIKPTQNGLLNFFKTVADKSFIPIIIYNIPSRSGVQISFETCKELASHENIIGIKEASGDMSFALRLSPILNEKFCLLAGNDNLLLPLLTSGARGIISVVGNINPQICEQVIQCFIDNNISDSMTYYSKYSNLIDSLSLESNPIPIKYALYRLGLIRPNYRKPLSRPSAKNRATIRKIIESINFSQK